MLSLVNESTILPMPEESRSASELARPTLTDSEREQLVHAIRRCARQKDLSSSVTDRYQAWIFAFVSWCRKHPPHRVDRDRIGAFQEALQQSADAGEKELYQAMDALAFLFGAADEVMGLLASWGVSSEDGAASAFRSDSGSRAGDEDGPQTLQVGWQSGPTASADTIQAPQIPLERAPNAPLPASTDADEEEESPEASSTAKICIERFKTQVESLHASDAKGSNANGQGANAEETARPEPNPAS